MRTLAVVVLVALFATTLPVAAAADAPVSCLGEFDVGEGGSWTLNSSATRFVQGTGSFGLADLRCSYEDESGAKSVAFHVLWSEGNVPRSDGSCSLSPEARVVDSAGPYPLVSSPDRNARVSAAPERGWTTVSNFNLTEPARSHAKLLLNLVNTRASLCDAPAPCEPDLTIADRDLHWASFAGSIAPVGGRGFMACFYRADLANASSLSASFRLEWYTEAQSVSPAWCFGTQTEFVTIPGKQAQVAWTTDRRFGDSPLVQEDAKGIAEDLLGIIRDGVVACGDISTAPTVAPTPVNRPGVLDCPAELAVGAGAVATLKLATSPPSVGPTPRGVLACEYATPNDGPLNFTIEWRPTGATTLFYLGCRHELPDRSTAFSQSAQVEARWTGASTLPAFAIFDSAMSIIVDLPKKAALACPEAASAALVDAPCPASVPMGDAQLGLVNGGPLGQDASRWREARCSYGTGDDAVTFVLSYAGDTGAKSSWPCSDGASDSRFLGKAGRAVGVEVSGNKGGQRVEDVTLVATALLHWYENLAIKCSAISATLPGPGVFVAVVALGAATLLIRSKRS